MKKATKTAVIVLAVLFVLQSAAFLTCQIGLQLLCSRQISCTYSLKERRNLAEVFSDAPKMKDRLNKTRMSLREKHACLESAEQYALVCLELNIRNDSDFWVAVKPRFKDFEGAWFIREPLGDKSIPEKANPHETSLCGYYVIVKNDSFEGIVSVQQVRPLAFVKVLDGPFVTAFIPKVEPV